MRKEEVKISDKCELVKEDRKSSGKDLSIENIEKKAEAADEHKAKKKKKHKKHSKKERSDSIDSPSKTVCADESSSEDATIILSSECPSELSAKVTSEAVPVNIEKCTTMPKTDTLSTGSSKYLLNSSMKITKKSNLSDRSVQEVQEESIEADCTTEKEHKQKKRSKKEKPDFNIDVNKTVSADEASSTVATCMPSSVTSSESTCKVIHEDVSGNVEKCTAIRKTETLVGSNKYISSSAMKIAKKANISEKSLQEVQEQNMEAERMANKERKEFCNLNLLKKANASVNDSIDVENKISLTEQLSEVKENDLTALKQKRREKLCL